MYRKESPKELKWDLSHIYENHDKYNDDLEKVNMLLSMYEKFKGQLGNKEVLLEYYKKNEELEKIYYKLASYTMLNHDVELNNNLYIEDQQKINNFVVKYSQLTAFIGPELAKLDDNYFLEILKDPRFKDYEYEIMSIIDNRKHILTAEQEQALSVVSNYSNAFSDMRQTLTENNFKFKPVTINGKKEELTSATYNRFLNNSDKKVRSQAYENMYEIYKQFSKTLSVNYINYVKLVNSDLTLRKYNSSFEKFNNSLKIPQKLFDNLIKNVDKNIILEQKYFKLLKKSTKIKDFGFEDVFQSLAKNADKKYLIDTQKLIILKALAPLGSEYENLLVTAFTKNWIDFCTDKDKKSGGYMLGVYGVHPYVFLNNNDNYSSMSTLAHELGHAMHTYYSSKYQPFSKHNYSTFIAEIASTVNEILLNKYMVKNSKTQEEKLFYLDNYLQQFKSAVFRQTMFAEFEDFAHKKIFNGEILSEKILNEKYKQLLEKHFADIVKIDDNIIHEWQRIPHFFTPYYVYNYATSFISAVYIANCILENKNDMLNRYRQMLKSGCDGYPTEILSKAGINLTKDDAYEYAFNDMKKSLKEVEQILNEEATLLK